MNERSDALRQTGRPGKIESLKKTGEEILFLCGCQLKVTAAVAYFTGQRLAAMKEAMEYGKFSAWLEKKFPLSRMTAYRYMDFYIKTSCVNLTQLKGLTMTEALRAAANLTVFGKNDPRMKKFYARAAEKIQMALEEYYQFYRFTLLEDNKK